MIVISNCRQCQRLLLSKEDREMGYCCECWRKLINMSSDEILEFVSRRFKDRTK